MKTGEATASPVLFLQSDSQGFVHGCEREGRKEGRADPACRGVDERPHAPEGFGWEGGLILLRMSQKAPRWPSAIAFTSTLLSL